jgi:predicted HTH transcriptional regulator
MREIATDILANFGELKSSQILKNLEVLDSFFEVAKAQNWVSIVKLLSIQEEYNRIKLEIKTTPKRPPKSKEKEIKGGRPLKNINSRQEKILAILKEKGRAQVWELKQVFPEVTKRTLRRDFESLLKQGKIERFGQRNETFYKIKITNDKSPISNEMPNIQ